MENPKVTVVIPMYNASKYITESVESILKQRYKKLEILIIDDGSTDNSLEIVKNINDERIKIIKNESNKGLPYTRNLGLKLAKTKYIALMDADDISFSERIYKQVEFMEKNNDVGIVCTHINVFGQIPILSKLAIKNLFNIKNEKAIKSKLVFCNCICNPSVMIRKRIIDENKISYRKEYCNSQDYGMWIDLINKTEFGIIKEKLINYRFGHENVTNKSREKKYQMHILLARQLFDEIGIEFNENDCKNFANIQLKIDDKYNIEKLNEFVELIEKLYKWNIENKIFDNENFNVEILKNLAYYDAIGYLSFYKKVSRKGKMKVDKWIYYKYLLIYICKILIKRGLKCLK